MLPNFVSEKTDVIQIWTNALDDNAEQKVHATTMLDEAICEDSASLVVSTFKPLGLLRISPQKL